MLSHFDFLSGILLCKDLLVYLHVLFVDFLTAAYLNLDLCDLRSLERLLHRSLLELFALDY